MLITDNVSKFVLVLISLDSLDDIVMHINLGIHTYLLNVEQIFSSAHLISMTSIVTMRIITQTSDNALDFLEYNYDWGYDCGEFYEKVLYDVQHTERH